MKLVDSDTMRRLDRISQTLYGIKGIVLMENAARGAAGIIRREFPKERCRRVSIICGKGNNGGDGFAIARHLKNSGYKVTVFSLVDIRRIKGDAGANARIWEKIRGETRILRGKNDIKKHLIVFRHSSVIVDAIFGTGLGLEVKGIYRDVIDTINSLSLPVLSVDIPSGIDASSGKILGCAVKATITAAMGFSKVGHCVYPGKDYAGKIELVDIGIPQDIIGHADFNLIDDSLVKEVLKPREKDTHKGVYGHTLIVGGSLGKTGAVYMAGMGAMRVGSGLVTLAAPQSLNNILEIKTTEVMTHPLPETDGMLEENAFREVKRILKGKTSVVIGPGLGDNRRWVRGEGVFGFVKNAIFECARLNIPVIVDADGLNALESKVEILRNATGKGGKIILTPHPGEMGRLLGMTTKDVQEQRIQSAKALFKKTGCVVILKGAATIVVSDKGVFINPTGNPGMATAGTGDILSGMLGGFLSQGLSPIDAAITSVYLHGLAGDMISKRQGEIGMVATDLLNIMPKVLNSFVGHF